MRIADGKNCGHGNASCADVANGQCDYEESPGGARPPSVFYHSVIGFTTH